MANRVFGGLPGSLEDVGIRREASWGLRAAAGRVYPRGKAGFSEQQGDVVRDKGGVTLGQAGWGLPVAARISGHYRWVICGLLFFAATVNFVDRQVIGLLKPTLQTELHWNEIDDANIVFAFRLAYAAGLLLVGRAMVWLGTRPGFSLAVFVWRVAAMADALARSVFGFGAARFALGLGKSGSFPASIKTVAEWFPKKERALATGIFNSGTNVGAIVTPLAMPWLTHKYGWQGAFVATGGHRVCLAGFVGRLVPQTGRAPRADCGGTGVHSERSGGNCQLHSVGTPYQTSANLGLCTWEVPDRPRLVAVPVLDPGLPAQKLRR